MKLTFALVFLFSLPSLSAKIAKDYQVNSKHQNYNENALVLALNKAQIDLKIFGPKTSKFKILENVTESSLVTSHTTSQLLTLFFCCYYVIVETCAHQYLTAVIVLLICSQSFRRMMKYLIHDKHTQLKDKKRKLKNSQNFFFLKKTRPSSCQFSSPLPFFSTTYLYCARHFFVQTTSGYYVFFLRPSKTKKIIHP